MKSIRSLCLVVGLALMFQACATALPPTYSAQAQRASKADQVLKAVTALDEIVINLNALPASNPAHVSGPVTLAIRDASLAFSNAVTAYVASGVPTALASAFDALNASLAPVAGSSDVAAAFALINTNVQLLIGAL